MSDLSNLVASARQQLAPILDRSGNILYSAARTLRPGPIYLLGLNPGGDPTKHETVRHTLEALTARVENAFLDERWERQKRPGQREIGSVEGKYADTQPRLYSVDADTAEVQRWSADFHGAVTRYAVNPDGSIEGRSPAACRLVAILGLDSDSYRQWRSIWMRIVELAQEYDREHYRRIMGFPDDLPRLDQSRPPDNTRPEGVQQSWYAKRQRGELPEVY